MWYVSVYGGVFVYVDARDEVRPDTIGTNLECALKDLLDVSKSESPPQLRNGLRQAGSKPPRTTTVPPRFGICASAPPAPETARSETASAAARASASSHQFSAFQSGKIDVSLVVPHVGRMSKRVDEVVEREHRHVLAQACGRPG